MRKNFLITIVSLGILTTSLFNMDYTVADVFKNNIENIKLLSPNPQIPPSTEDYEIATPFITLGKKFQDIKALKEESDLIVEGKAKTTKTIIVHNNPITITELEVYEVYKTDDDNIKKGSTICMGENGGILSKEYLIEHYKNKFGIEPKDAENIKPIKEAPDGILPMEVGDHVLIFAIKASDFTEGNCYFVVGAYQGKFSIYGDKVKHQVPDMVEAFFKDKVVTKKELIDKINSN